MEFVELYRFAEKLSQERAASGKKPLVAFSVLRDETVNHTDWLTEVNVWRVEAREDDPWGHYECHGEVESPHEWPETWVALISYDAALNACHRRFVWTKELMHVFDSDEGLVKSEGDYLGLLNEIELEPLKERSKAYVSENDAKWMALICLCPKPHRDRYRALVQNGDISQYEMAVDFRIPEALIRFVISEEYDVAYSALTS